MKVCLIAPLPPFKGGIPKYCHSLAKELEKRHDLLLLSYERQYPKALFGKKSQTDPKIDREELLREFRNLSYDIDSANLVSWRSTAKRIAAFRPDIVIFPWWVVYWAPMYLYLLHALKSRGARLVFLCINVYEHEESSFKRFLTRLMLGRIDCCVVHSEEERIEVLEINPRATVKKHLLPLFDYGAKATSRREGTLNLLFFGFVRPYKGLDTLLNAVGLLKERGIMLKIAGEFWNDKERYLRLISDLGISDRVEIVDRYIPDDEVSFHFSWADLVVLPYKKSKTSGIIATAYGYRKPVLVTDVGGFHEIVKDGSTGKIVPPDDPRSFADGIVWFMDNREIDFAHNIIEFTSQTMSWGSLVDMIEEFRQGFADSG